MNINISLDLYSYIYTYVLTYIHMFIYNDVCMKTQKLPV